MKGLPDDPFSGEDSALHELFVNFMAQGFTEDQALTLLAKMMAAMGGKNGSDGQGRSVPD